MKTAVIICAFDTYFERVRLLKKYYESIGFNTLVITSNFRHFKKTFVEEKIDSYVYIDTKPYYKNISFSRLYSHYKFSKDAFNKVKEIKPNLLHVLIPPNSLTKEAYKYKKDNKNLFLNIDIIDLWPETMPIGNLKNYFPFSMWRNVRDNYLSNADNVFVECNLFENILKTKNKDIDFHTLYWAKETKPLESHPKLPDDRINLCYLGSINNIIDIEMIAKICKEINNIKPLTLCIIGDGENREEFISKVESTGAKVEYYGVIYDQGTKQKVFDKCHFGLNIMKNTVCVGLTMKSLDYFSGSLPIINNIQGDTKQLCETEKIGYNVSEQHLSSVAKTICEDSVQDNLLKRVNVNTVFKKYFIEQSFKSVLEKNMNTDVRSI